MIDLQSQLFVQKDANYSTRRRGSVKTSRGIRAVFFAQWYIESSLTLFRGNVRGF